MKLHTVRVKHPTMKNRTMLIDLRKFDPAFMELADPSAMAEVLRRRPELRAEVEAKAAEGAKAATPPAPSGTPRRGRRRKGDA